MRLWLLKYDNASWIQTEGVVVRAKDEAEARTLCAKFDWPTGGEPYLFSQWASCEAIPQEGEPAVLLESNVGA